MIDVNVDAAGQPIFTSWVPSNNDFESANEIYIDETQKAAMRVKKAAVNDDGEKAYYELVSQK
jgi:predicted naringenin-chalcone synthase